MPEKMGIDDWIFHFQQTGAGNANSEIEKMIEANSVPFVAADQAKVVADLLVQEVKKNQENAKEILWREDSLDVLAGLSDVELQRFFNSVEAVGVRGFKSELRKALTETRKKNRLPIQRELSTVDDCFPDKNLPVEVGELVIPPKWEIGMDGLFQWVFDKYAGERIKTQVTFTPVLITKRLIDVNNDSEKLEIVFFRDGRWRTVIDNRNTFAEPRKFINLTNCGFSVNTGNAAQIIKFLQDFEAANLNIPMVRATGRFGWHGDNFVLGNSVYSKDEAAPIIFHSNDADVNATAGAIRQKGTLGTWVNAIKKATAGRPRLMFLVAAGFAGPLLKILEIDSFIIDVSGRSSQGKTSAVQLVASAYGYAGKKEADSLLRAFDATIFGIENLCFAFNDCLLVLDDSLASLEEKMLKKIIYVITNGSAKTRGNINLGNRIIKRWSLVTLTTGEGNLVDVSTWGGTRGRILTLQDVWGGTCAETVFETVETILSNFGHAGPAFIEWLLKGKSDWGKLVMKFKELRKTLILKCPGNEVAGRRAAYFAAVVLAAVLIDNLFNFGWGLLKGFQDGKLPEIFGNIFDEVVMKGSDLSTGMMGLSIIKDFLLSNKNSFEIDDVSERPLGKIFGRWVSGDFIGVYKSLLYEELRRHGFNPEAVVNELKDRGILEEKSKRLSDGPRKLLCLDWKHVE